MKTTQTPPEYNKMVEDGMKGYQKGGKSAPAGDNTKTEKK